MLDVKESMNALISHSEASSDEFNNKTAYSYFEITLSGLVGLVNKFVQID